MRFRLSSLLHRTWIILLLSATFLPCVTGVVWALDQHSGLYKDNNGYFIAVPPLGWKIQTFSSETIRSKVRFNHPELTDVYIQIIAAPTPRNPYAMDDLLADYRGNREIVMRVTPGATFNVTKEKIGDREAVVQWIERGGSGLKSVIFLDHGVYYQVALSTNTLKEHEALSETYLKLLYSFTTMEPGRRFTDDERKSAFMARYKTVAEIYLRDGDKSRALTWVQEGLRLDPDNKELAELRNRLTDKHAR